MTREHLLQQLSRYRPFDEHETAMAERLRDFVASHPDCFERSLAVGHITGSAWVVDADRSHVLLTHHGKLDKWLQLGGHADGDPDVLRVALREVMEESGLEDIRPLSEDIFDVDVHLIPARGHEPEHFHYDVRFLLEADRNAPLQITGESKALEWVKVNRVVELTQEESILRMLRKARIRFGC
ncbi:MAG: NUDIX hydrolase [Bryobacteraceae bacterium]|jgi:NUDIX domain.|nr:NUDIX hydrolase [Bryobacteraceae bacterium]